MTERADIGQYDVRFDSKRFHALQGLQGTQSFEEVLGREIDFVNQQLETDNRERLNVRESHFVYEINDGKLYGGGEQKPFETSLKRAAEGKIGYSREHADLDAFLFTQEVLADPSTPDGTKVAYASPPDEKNRMNFFDVHTKVGDSVHSIRYLSNLSNNEYRDKILGLNPAYEEVIPEDPTDKDLLKSPLIVPTHLDFTPDSLADYFIPDREKLGMSKEEHQKIWQDLTPQITSMVNTLVENPEAIDVLEDKYTRIQAKATELAGGINYLLENGKDGVIVYIDEKPQIIAGGGCGGEGCSVNGLPGIDTGGLKDEHGKLDYTCPSCKKKNTRSIGHLDMNCPKCGSDEVLPPAARKMLN